MSLLFNQTCLNERLLPKYTYFKTWSCSSPWYWHPKVSLQQPLMLAYETSERARDNFGKFLHQFQPKTKTLIRKLKRILIKLYRRNVSLLFNQTCLNERLLPKYTYFKTWSCSSPWYWHPKVSLQQPLMLAYETFERARDNFGKFLHQFQPKTKTFIRKIERILIELYRQNVSLLFNQTCLNERLLPKYTYFKTWSCSSPWYWHPKVSLQQPLMLAYETFERARDNFGKFLHQFQPKTKTLIRKLERILIKLYRRNVSLLFNQTCLNERLLPKYTYFKTWSCSSPWYWHPKVSLQQPLMLAYETPERARDNFGKFLHQFQPKTKTLIRKLERILIELYKRNVSLLFNQTCLNERLLPNHTHTHTHAHIYIYIYIYVCVCVCVFTERCQQ